MIEDNDSKWLLWHISGTPLSGRNSCGFVNPQGEKKFKQVLPFIDILSCFTKINTRYDPVKGKYDAYTLRKVLGIIKNLNYT